MSDCEICKKHNEAFLPIEKIEAAKEMSWQVSKGYWTGLLAGLGIPGNDDNCPVFMEVQEDKKRVRFVWPQVEKVSGCWSGGQPGCDCPRCGGDCN